MGLVSPWCLVSQPRLGTRMSALGFSCSPQLQQGPGPSAMRAVNREMILMSDLTRDVPTAAPAPAAAADGAGSWSPAPPKTGARATRPPFIHRYRRARHTNGREAKGKKGPPAAGTPSGSRGFLF